MALKPIGVSQLNDYLSRVIGSDPIMSNVLIKGEASGVKYHYSHDRPLPGRLLRRREEDHLLLIELLYILQIIFLQVFF